MFFNAGRSGRAGEKVYRVPGFRLTFSGDYEMKTTDHNMEAMRIDGVIFDMDGLLFDTEAVYQRKWREVAGEFGLTLPDSFAAEICGTSGQLKYDIIRKYYENVDTPKSISLEVRRRVTKELMVHLPEKKGLHEILDFFKSRNLPMAVASSSPMESIQHHLSVSGIGDYFAKVVCGAQVAHGKPAPDIFLLAAFELGVPAERCLIFEDAVNGIRAASSSGGYPVMIPDLVQPTDEIRALCWGVFEDLTAARDTLAEVCYLKT